MQLFGPVGCAKYVPIRHFVGGDIIYSSYHNNFGNFMSRCTKNVQIFRHIDHSRRVFRHKMERKRKKSRKKDTYKRLSRRCVEVGCSVT
jgi:hypothetical protein